MKGDKKCTNWGGLGVRGHPKSSETSPFDRLHMTSNSTLIELCVYLVPFSSYSTCVFRRKWRIFDHPTCICRPHRGWSHLNFAMNFGVRTRVTRLSCGIICMILCLAVLIQYWSVPGTHTDGQTDGQTDRHTTMAYTVRRVLKTLLHYRKWKIQECKMCISHTYKCMWNSLSYCADLSDRVQDACIPAGCSSWCWCWT